MAMMTGRVLLVCALCVLWCGAGGRCDEEIAKDPVGPSGAPGNLGKDGMEKADRSAVGHGELGLVPEPPKDVSQGGPSERTLGGPGGDAVDKNKDVLISGKVDEFKSPSPEKQPPGTDDPAKSIEEEVELQQQRNDGKELENQPQLQVPVTQQEHGVLPLSLPHPQSQQSHQNTQQQQPQPQILRKEGGMPHEKGSEKGTQELDKLKEESQDTELQNKVKEEKMKQELKNEEKGGEHQPQLHVPVEQQEQSALPQPPQSMQQPSPPQEQPRQQKQQPPHGNPADNEQESKTDKNAVGTNKTANGTATPADSDGSTAVSHTTSSPLLLLLVVACAAAAAVVAA
ncbi:Mucin-associated surface protein (MASP) [Trypanosoma cruzi]|uniref:Mucin-associated surface protein (MASP), putative n=2 Tax=Trypanosoma cruzi TaxID=5693 RepID=Q4DQS0_TRYCC|nr:mucin-associated surface protein (MASP), putative [Trypanosoma cruzi]EAN94876.1 mucin-associated surface protein (MASP), putative [Trypanosoma cruzi]PWV17826.1 Mucin-associated surface protein (MASP) [Trypanosoma cruzi]|eukprot:XP_816727.1 mucin-associated surface protein (MASP) [Trypanosoma cruzi strain CL Brener]